MIRNIIFDAGSVIVDYRQKTLHSNFIANLLSISPEKAKEIWNKDKYDIVIGKISTKEYINKLNKKFKTPLISEKLYIKWINSFTNDVFNINFELIKLIKKLRKKYNLYLLTNMLDSLRNHKVHLHISSLFDKTYRSFELKMMKPNKNIYLYVLKDASIKSNETIFIDDKKENIETAKKLGFKTILYINNKNLFKKLKNYGIEI